MKHGTQRPYEDGDKVAFLGTHPVDELTSEEVGNGIEDGEPSGDGTIVVVIPMELGSDKVFPG